jgi:threonyl-tRNA synthetase
MATAAPAPVSSTAEPAQLPALKGPHAGDKKPKDKKAKGAAVSEYPLEVSSVTGGINHA